MSNKVLYVLWGGSFILCAGLGFIPEPEGALATVLLLASVVFFLPPAVILYRAKRYGDEHNRKLICLLAALSLGATLILLLLNFLCATRSQVLGTMLYYLLVVVSSPMICSGYWVLSLFLWACLLTASLQKDKK